MAVSDQSRIRFKRLPAKSILFQYVSVAIAQTSVLFLVVTFFGQNWSCVSISFQNFSTEVTSFSTLHIHFKSEVCVRVGVLSHNRSPLMLDSDKGMCCHQSSS